jgi:hypothetical protein
MTLVFSSHSHDTGRFGTITFEPKANPKMYHIFDTGPKEILRDHHQIQNENNLNLNAGWLEQV